MPDTLPQELRRDRTRSGARRTAFARHPLLYTWRKIVRRRGLSERFDVPSDPDEIYRRLVELPVSLWTYGFDHPTVRHLGPMAQDFGAAFGLGSTDHAINMVDTNGVVMVSIQVLAAKVAELEKKMARCKCGAAEGAGSPTRD